MICCKCGKPIERSYGRVNDLGNYCRACAIQNEVEAEMFATKYWKEQAEMWKQCTYDIRKETAKKFARQVEFHSVATMQDNVEYFTISALSLKEILHEEFDIPYEELATENT